MKYMHTMYVRVYIYISLYIYLSISLSLYIYIYTHIHTHISLSLSLYIYIYISYGLYDLLLISNHISYTGVVPFCFTRRHHLRTRETLLVSGIRSVLTISCLFLRPRPWRFEIRDSTDT